MYLVPLLFSSIGEKITICKINVSMIAWREGENEGGREIGKERKKERTDEEESGKQFARGSFLALNLQIFRKCNKQFKNLSGEY